MQWTLLGFALIAGVLNTFQTGANTQLNKALGMPPLALTAIGSVTMISGLIALATTSLTGGPRLQLATLAQVPWWGWTGGALGAVYVLANLLVADKVGAAVFMGVTVTAAVLTSLIMDHFGLLGFEVKQAGLGRIAGGLLMIGGLVLIARS